MYFSMYFLVPERPAQKLICDRLWEKVPLLRIFSNQVIGTTG